MKTSTPLARLTGVFGAALLVAVCALFLVSDERAAEAGGPLLAGSPTRGTDGQPILWDISSPIVYRTDGGGLGTLNNAAAIARVQAMFQAWQDVPTSAVSFSNAGGIQTTGGFTDGDVDSAFEFNEVEASCDAGTQSPIMFDANGNLFSQLGLPSGVIGFAGPCNITGSNITSGMAALNGRWIDGNAGNGELTAAEFDQAFAHEFGHFAGLHHSQINVSVLNGQPNACSADNLAGLPLMFPFLFCQARPLASVLAPDDIAWISRLYPETVNSPPSRVPFNSSYGTITGTIFFSDGITHAQGVNVIARRVDVPGTPAVESRRIAVSVVSGYLFTGNPGQSVTGTNPGSSFGSRNPALIGTYEIPLPPGDYHVEVESIFDAFVGGSGVGPLTFPIPNPGVAEFWDSNESATDSPAATAITVSPGAVVSNINIILNGTPPRFDSFEGAQLAPSPTHLFAWLRKENWRDWLVAG